MIQPVDNSSNAPPKSSNGGVSAGSGASFATALASATQQTQAGSGIGDGSVTEGINTDLKPPKGETWAPVPGHSDYADILSGPRDGFFVSLSGPRKGQAFVIVHRHGKTFHVYGEGKNKQWISVPTNPADLRPPKGETWQPVHHHHDYKKIEGGRRANQYVNLSGNARTGQAFTIDHHDGKTWHVYGSGADRREVAVGGHRRAQLAPPSPAAPQQTNGNATGPG
jgi:hypothetical protein